MCAISQGISRYIVTSCPVSCDITRYGISRYRIIYISHIFGTDMEISYQDDFFLDTEHYFLPVTCTNLGAPKEYKKRLFGDRTSEAVILIGKCTL